MEHTIIDMTGKILTPINHLSSLTRRTAHKLVKIIKNKHHKWQLCTEEHREMWEAAMQEKQERGQGASSAENS